jgi:hypothetical protein
MKMIKSLILGSAAGLVAMGGAQAADLPVKAKAVEYVRICSLYGAGFFYIPGTDTCIKLGGYLRVDAVLNSNSDNTGNYNGIAGANNRYKNYITTRSREDLNIDTRTATEYGVVRTYFDGVFTWTTGSATPAATGSTIGPDTVAGGSLGVYYAYIQFAGFTMGKAVSQFDAPWTNYPGNNGFDALVGGSGSVTGVNQFSYTAQFGNGVSGTISAQDQTQYFQSNIWNTALSVPAATLLNTPTPTFTSTNGGTLATGAYGVQSFGGQVAPDLVGQLRVDQAWGLFQASVAAHDNHSGYYTTTNEASGHPGDKWGWAGQLALSIKNIPTGPGDTINVQGVYTNGASRYNFQSLVPTTFAIYSGTGLAGAYQSVGFASVSDAVFGTNGDLQLTTTYGMRGGYTHNWDPHWNTAIYGAFAAVRYNDTAKGLVCGNYANLTRSVDFTCNPDFNLSQIGTVTRWTPVKNLTFAAEVTYTMLDQKYTGALTLPAQAGIAKPASVYELKDQNSLLMQIRAQRNF